MNNRFKFRGKSNKLNNEFVEGSLLQTWDYTHYNNVPHYNAEIMTTAGNKFVVDSNTIGQCTGLRDKTGKLIFEGDIVKDPDPEKKYKNFIYKIKYDVERCRYYLLAYIDKIKKDCDDIFDFSDFDTTKGLSLEIIGNIYENSELLEINNHE